MNRKRTSSSESRSPIGEKLCICSRWVSEKGRGNTFFVSQYTLYGSYRPLHVRMFTMPSLLSFPPQLHASKKRRCDMSDRSPARFFLRSIG